MTSSLERILRRRQSSRRRHVRSSLAPVLVFLLAFASSPRISQNGVLVEAGNYYRYSGNYYNGGGNYYNNGGGGNYQNYNNYYKNNGNDDANNNQNDDANNNNGADDGNAYYGNNDDGNKWNNDDNDDAKYNNDDANYNNGDDAVNAEAAAYSNHDDDVFHWNTNEGFDGVSVMPISCINYNGGQMIKFQLFDSENSYQCHFSEIATFVVSIAHYMRAYFNYQALLHGKDFELPGDAGYLNCVMLQETVHSDVPLYAKIGCMDRETFTSTKLQLHVYTDNQCSQPFDDGQNSRRRVSKGYDLNGYIFPTRVSFRPNFYTCDSCSPTEISETYNKQYGNWYDDYYISQNGQKNGNNNGNYNGNNNDAYQRANDDVPRDDDTYYNPYGYNYNSFQNDDDDYYKADDNANANNDDNNRQRHRNLESREFTRSIAAAAPGQLEAYNVDFWHKFHAQTARSLYENNYDAGNWNMCQQLYKYGVWCDEECRALDFFRTDQWSASDIFLLSIMCTFVTAMMLLVIAKRLKAQQKAKLYGEEQPMPGLPPLAMALIFVVIMFVVVALAKLRFVNETLVFAVVTCVLLFIYVLRLTLFESPRPVLLAAPSYFERYDDKNFGGY